jgi:hypothetical protein
VRLLLAVASVAAVLGALSAGVSHSGSEAPHAHRIAGGLSLVPRSTTTTTMEPALGAIPTPLSGCPPPPPKPGAAVHPWTPAVLVPDNQLPAAPLAAPRVASLAALAGKGMWIWQAKATEGGNGIAVARRAAQAGVQQLWVRVGDSRYGFYNADWLASVVPAAHARGIDVIGWGFPHLYDPVADVNWTNQAMSWVGSDGRGLDGFSADIEMSTEGVQLTAQRAAIYLGMIRPAVGTRPLVATVYRPTDRLWATYPYAAIAPYVDAFAPMVYWGCVEPGAAATQALGRLSKLAPVHLIGQAYDMAAEGGRLGAPPAAEVARFLDVARRNGAVGASFWDWQEMNADEWSALSHFSWPVPRAPKGAN